MVAHAAASHAADAQRANAATVAGDCARAHRAPCTLVQSGPTDLPKTELLTGASAVVCWSHQQASKHTAPSVQSVE